MRDFDVLASERPHEFDVVISRHAEPGAGRQHASDQRRNLLPNYMRSEIAIGPGLVAFVTESLGHVEDDCRRESMILAGKRNEAFAVLLPDIGGIDHGEPAFREALARDVVERVE